jgi:hypothetical protein
MSVLACDRCVSLGDAYTCRRCRMSLSLLPASYLIRRVGVRRACDGDGQAGGTQRFSPPSPSAGNLVAREARMSTSEHEHGGMWCDRPEFVCLCACVGAPISSRNPTGAVGGTLDARATVPNYECKCSRSSARSYRRDISLQGGRRRVAI